MISARKFVYSVRIKLYTVFYGARVKGGEIIGEKRPEGVHVSSTFFHSLVIILSN